LYFKFTLARIWLGKAVRLHNWPLHLGGVLEAAAGQLYMKKSGHLPSLERVMKPEAVVRYTRIR
jgi:hypothetical protein